MEWGAAITAVCALALALLKLWVDGKPTRAEKEKADDDAKLREECESLDADAITARIDGLLSQDDSASGVPDPGSQKRATGPG